MREKSHRLPAHYYVGRVCLSITACENRRRPLLANARVFDLVRHAFEDAATEFGCTVPIFCLMPDHMHAVIIGSHDRSDSLSAMYKFKQDTGDEFWKIGIDWQKDFYDRIVRKAKDGRRACDTRL